jgi:hypothetical protein
VRRFALIGVLIWPLAGLAQNDWTPMSGAEIRTALSDQKLRYASAWQDFRASGKTLYNAGADSWGYWRVEEDRYCSQWPPSDIWACYDMQRRGDTVRFVGPNGDTTEATYFE